jgi:hypothetical protein
MSEYITDPQGEGSKATLVSKRLVKNHKPNEKWHREHRMPRNPTIQQRVDWHKTHAEMCGCRPMPKSIQLILEKSKNETK